MWVKKKVVVVWIWKVVKKDRISRNIYKRIEFMVIKGICVVYKIRRCERILLCKSEVNGCISEVKMKMIWKRVGESESRMCERRVFSWVFYLSE